jgi:FKBP-type peptidyl-prolyl cis-trans isomerase
MHPGIHLLLRKLKNTWQLVFQRLTAQDETRLHTPDHGLYAVNNEKQSVLTELHRVQDDLNSAKSRDAELLSALKDRIVAMDAASEAATREISELRESLADAAVRQEKTETQVRLLRERQESERREHQAYVQESLARERKQNRGLGWAMLLACCALLLGTLAGTATIRDGRQYAGLLAELSRDIKDIKASVERQVAALQVPESDAPSVIAVMPGSERGDAATTGTNRPDAARHQPDIASAITHYHPHNKYRNRREMLAFFNENASELGMVSVADGLQYRVVDQGAGKSPGATDTVILDYSAFLLDGTQLFSSYDESLPVQFSVSQLVPGLREVVPRMAEGARWEVYVSPDHAYRGGTRNRKKYGYEPLVYVVELKSVIDAGDSAL